MNIKTNDVALVEKLKEAALVMCPVGSRAYGITHEYSDYDYLYIYPTPKAELLSVFQSHHQLQYKDREGNDHLFVSLRSYLANLVSGDSLLNFEALHTTEMRGSVLRELTNSKAAFYTTKIVRAYLGRARKDHKDYAKLPDVDVKKRLKKLGHLIRSYHFAETIREGTFALDIGIVRAFTTKVNGCSLERQHFYANHYLGLVEFLREKIDHNVNYQAAVMSVNNQLVIDSVVGNILKKKEYKEKKRLLRDFNMAPFYEANENGVSYTI
jgi:predicted nucleotidyltransferase